MKTTNIILYLFLGFLALEVVVLSRQNMVLKKQILLNSQLGTKGGKKSMVGTSVPSLNGTKENGESFSIDYNNTNQKTLLFIFSLSCPECLNIIPEWRMLTDQLLEFKNIRVIGVVRGDIPTAQKYITGYLLNYPVLICHEEDDTITKEYGAHVVPTTMLLDKTGKILNTIEGMMNQKQIDELINIVNNS